MGMTNEELIADRIELLAGSLAFAQNQCAKCADDAYDLLIELRAAEAKLAKAVDAIKVIIFTAHGDDHEGWHDALDDAQKLITELEKTE
jgi:bacterioferritin-associated ferredoxin